MGLTGFNFNLKKTKLNKLYNDRIENNTQYTHKFLDNENHKNIPSNSYTNSTQTTNSNIEVLDISPNTKQNQVNSSVNKEEKLEGFFNAGKDNQNKAIANETKNNNDSLNSKEGTINSNSTSNNINGNKNNNQKTATSNTVNTNSNANQKSQNTTSTNNTSTITNSNTNNNFSTTNNSFSMNKNNINTQNMNQDNNFSKKIIQNKSETHNNSFVTSKTSLKNKKVVNTATNLTNNIQSQISLKEYEDYLKRLGLRKNDIEKVFSQEISIDNLIKEIENDTDNSRRKEIMIASYLQSAKLNCTNLEELQKIIANNQNTLKKLQEEKRNIENFTNEKTAWSKILSRLQNGETLENILKSEVVAYSYINEDGNLNYIYSDPYSTGNTPKYEYTPLTYEELYGDSRIKEIKNILTESDSFNFFGLAESKKIHIWQETKEQQDYLSTFYDEMQTDSKNIEKETNKIQKEIDILVATNLQYKEYLKQIENTVNYYMDYIDPYIRLDDLEKYNFEKNNIENDISKLLELSNYQPNPNDLKSYYNDTSWDGNNTITITNKAILMEVLCALINDSNKLVNQESTLTNKDGTIFINATDKMLKNYIEWIPLMTDDEKAIFNYIYQTEGYEKAYNYLENITNEMDNRWLANKVQIDQEFASNHPVLASVSSVFITPIEGIGAACASLSALYNNANILRTDVYSSGDIWRTKISQDLATNYKHGEGLAFFYSTGMSILDSTSMIGISAITGGTATPFISATMMGSRAYTSTLNDALDRGLSDGKAVALAFSSAVAETAMENYSLSHLLNLEKKLGKDTINFVEYAANNVSNTNLANIITKSLYVGANTLSQAFVEGEEELATEILNYLFDELIAGKLSNKTIQINQFLENGYTIEEAQNLSRINFYEQLKQSFLGGFVSGVFFGAFGGIKATHNISQNIASDIMNQFNVSEKQASESLSNLSTTKAKTFANQLQINEQINKMQEQQQKQEHKEKIKEFINYLFNKNKVNISLNHDNKYFSVLDTDFGKNLYKTEVGQKIINSWEEQAVKIPKELGEYLQKIVDDPTKTLGIHRNGLENPNILESGILQSIMKDGLINNGASLQGAVTNSAPSISQTISTITNSLYLAIYLKGAYTSPGSYTTSQGGVIFSFPADTVDENGDVIKGKENEVYEQKNGLYYVKPEYILGYVAQEDNICKFYSKEEILEKKRLALEKEFNNGKISIENLVQNWNKYKNEDLNYFLQNDIHNEFHITDKQLKDFMNKFENISNLICNNTNIYQFIHEINDTSKNESEKHEYIKQITDNILEKTIKKENNQQIIKLSNNEYKELFKYSSIKDYLLYADRYREYDIDIIFKELETLPQNYIFDIPIPFDILNNSDVLRFIGTYGLKNVVDFDNECGQFFTKNNCEMLKLMNDMYLRYNLYDTNMSVHTKKVYDNKPYTKDEFYEAIRRMIIYGPNNHNYIDKAPDYRNMTGEFRIRNAELFISEQAPEELQKLFYSKSITPELLIEHQDYIPYLKGKDLSSCFKLREIKVEGSKNGSENFYNFIEEKTDFNSAMNFITEYNDILDIVFDRNEKDRYQNEIKFFKEDNIDEIQRKINEIYKRIFLRRIKNKGIVYPKNIPQNLKENCPTLFLSSDSPKELQDAFYNRTINTEFILANPSYETFLKNVEFELMFKYMPVYNRNDNSQINLVSIIKQIFGPKDSFDVMFSYGKYIESVFTINKLQNFKYNQNFSKDSLLDELDNTILQTIIDGNMKYDENIPNHFKNNNPTLFLSQDVPQDIRNKFYNREFTLNDFNANPKLLDMFENANIVCGFSENISWMIPLFNDLDNIKKANFNRLKVISEFLKIQDTVLQNFFKEYTLEQGSNLNMETIDYLSEVLLRLSSSNSSEMFTFRKELATQILKSTNPIKSLNEIEDIFIKNNIPTVGKIYSCFEILHPNFQGFDFSDRSKVSPILKKSSTMGKKMIVFSDLIKSSFGSNNRSVNDYLKNIENGSKLYESIKSGQIKYDSLDKEQKNELITFKKHLITIYNNTIKGKNETFTPTQDVLTDILELSKKLSPDGTLDYNLADRVIRMFCGFTGINTLEQAKSYINQKIKFANARNRNASSSEMILEQGDFIKGIGDITYLRNILQNGSVSKEYLGSSAGSDATPLDTDVSLIIVSDGTIEDKIRTTNANDYGPIWFVLKNDDRFITTRTNNGTFNIKNDMSKMEAFYTGVLSDGHYGIRTGFASSEINYIVTKNDDPRIGLEIAMNGFYIPIANREGKIIFTPNDYDKLREKMSGLSYYNENNYTFSKNLVTKETSYLSSQIEQSNYEVQVKRAKINEIIKKSLEELGLHLKTNIDGDLTEGFVELIDTGSTGRGTNKPGDGDFDFMMRLDKKILSDSSKIEKLNQTLLRNLGKENSSELTGTGDFRLKGVQIDSDINVDIDITFTEKTDKITYSTDMALQDRLATIKKISPEKYKYVIANILLAKQVLKQAEVYKPNHSDRSQGGLGGVGIENWILQNGGSFIDAATDFIKAAEGKNFDEFKATYQIWDFGDNHLAERRNSYPHDNFVSDNMNEVGYNKMVEALKEYLKNVNFNKEIN